MTQRARWTVLVFMAGDNNLSSAGECDLEEMRRVGSSEFVNLLVEFDNAGEAGTRRIRVGKNGVNETIETLGETDSGSPEVLSSFISWAAENYPADHYALILWNHGGGWAPTEVDRIARSVNSPGYNGREITERSASSLGRVFFRSSLEQVFGLAGASERAICSDDGSGHSLDTIELGKVIAQGAERIGQAFDLLGMDACLMSNIEVAYQVRNHVGYVVASEETEPGDGWPYDSILGRLVANPTMVADDIARHIVSDYIGSYLECGHCGNITQTALDLSKLSTITGPLDDFAGLLTASMPTVFPKLWKAQRGAAQFAQNTLWDLGHFCQVLEQSGPDTDVGKAANAVWAALEPSAGNFVLAESHRGKKVLHCRGVSIYLVPPITKISRYYSELDFARSHNWAGMLEAYHRV
ncbi:MAG: hypothetical protein GY732_12525 [Gammaproteobacteria bacterium]|nr:hypothetical protein [Gammaproteobacteria bacterium]